MLYMQVNYKSTKTPDNNSAPETSPNSQLFLIEIETKDPGKKKKKNPVCKSDRNEYFMIFKD